MKEKPKEFEHSIPRKKSYVPYKKFSPLICDPLIRSSRVSKGRM